MCSFGNQHKTNKNQEGDVVFDKFDEIEELDSALFFDAAGNDSRQKVLRTSVVNEVSQVDTGSVSQVIANNNEKLSFFILLSKSQTVYSLKFPP